MDFSRLDSNAKLEKSENDISQLVDYCVNEVQTLLKERNLKTEVEKDSDIPLINCNYDSIARALTNYLSNAIKYAPSDSTIKVKLYRDNNDVVVTVSDEGIGIAPEFQKKVFERFYRVENKTHSVKGTGLGLHLVKTTIEKHHHGHVFVNSGLYFNIIEPDLEQFYLDKSFDLYGKRDMIKGLFQQEFRKVVICGSFQQHMDDICNLINSLNKHNIQVLSPWTMNVVPETLGTDFILLEGQELVNKRDSWRHKYDHMNKFKKADAIIVCNPNGRIGKGTMQKVAVRFRYRSSCRPQIHGDVEWRTASGATSKGICQGT